MLRLTVFIFFSIWVISCDTTRAENYEDYNEEESNDPTDTECNFDVGLAAMSNPSPESGPFRFYGTTNAPNDVTVRAIYIGSTKAKKDEFNYRAWTADVDMAQLKALAVDGVASVPVVAFTSAGCQSLAEDEMPRITLPVDDNTDTSSETDTATTATSSTDTGTN